MAISSKVAERLTAGLKYFRPILEAAKSKDVNEADTVVIVIDLLADMFGFDKFGEITSELCIKGAFCDLAIRIQDKFKMIIEVKHVNAELKGAHINQAVGYAAKSGITWVALTNGSQWKVFRVLFDQPIDQELALDIDLLTLSPKDQNKMENLYLLTHESMLKSGLDGYYDELQVVNKFMFAAVLMSEPVLGAMRRQLHRISPEIRVKTEKIQEVLLDQVLKREATEGERFEAAKRKVSRAARVPVHPEKKGQPTTEALPEESKPAIVDSSNKSVT